MDTVKLASHHLTISPPHHLTALHQRNFSWAVGVVQFTRFLIYALCEAFRFALNRYIAILDFGETRATKHQPRPKTDAIEKQG